MAFADIFGALAEIGYAGPLVVESFASLTDEVVAAFALWRDIVGDPARFSAASLAWFRHEAETHQLAPTRFGPFEG